MAKGGAKRTTDPAQAWRDAKAEKHRVLNDPASTPEERAAALAAWRTTKARLLKEIGNG